MAEQRWCCLSRRKIETMSPYVLILLLEIITASYTIMSKIIFTEGTNPFVFDFYQFMVALTFMAPLAFIFERKSRPPLTLSLICWMFLLGLLGVTLYQNLLSASLNYISSTSQAAIGNLFPAFTYILSVASRQERAELNRLHGIGKLCGTLLSVSGAFTLVLWHSEISMTTSLNSLVGYILALSGTLSLSTWLVVQCPVAVRYQAELSMTSIMLLFGAMQTFMIAATSTTFFSNTASSTASEWKLNWNLELVNIIFGGLLNSGMCCFIAIWCARKKGPLFVAVFAPLSLILTVFMEMIILGSTMDLRSAVGGVMIIGGLYLFLWSKTKEEDDDGSARRILTSPLLPNQIS